MKIPHFVQNRIEKIRSKRDLHEYGHRLRNFELSKEGTVAYAQWLHPYEQVKVISQDMVDFFREWCTPGGLAIDIGAHTGDTTIPMALAAGKQGLTLALEPNPYVFKILKTNASLNPEKTRIIPLDFAATETDGEFEFNYSDASYCNGGFFQSLQNQKHGHHHILKVKGKNLENFLHAEYGDWLNRLSLIKVDAEGYDKEIIRSLQAIIKEYRPNIISECNKNLNWAEREDLFGLLKSMDYTVKKTEGFTMSAKPSEIHDGGEMMKWQHFDLVATPRR